MRLISAFILCCFLSSAQAQITAGPDPAPGNDCMSTPITLNYAGEVNGRSSYSFSNGQSDYVISWTGAAWEFRLDGIFLLSSNEANTLEPPCSSTFPWISGLGCDFGQAPYIGGPSCSTAPLAIELVGFNIQVQNRFVVLGWTTARESDNARFTIERSPNDDLHWESIGFVTGGGTTLNHSTYTFTDDAPREGLIYYRLLWQDFDGKKEYSRVLSVHLASQTAISLTPNPVQNILTITFSEAPESASLLRLFDAQGRLIKSQALTETQMELDMTQCLPGFYCTEIVGDGGYIHRYRLVKN